MKRLLARSWKRSSADCEAAASIGGRAAIRLQFKGAELKRADSGVIDVAATLTMNVSMSASATLLQALMTDVADAF
jgi:hypothetical protein